MRICRRLRDLFFFPGFFEVATLKKRQCVRTAGIAAAVATISVRIGLAICAWRGGSCTWNLIAGACNARGALACT